MASIINGTYEGGITHQFPNGSYIGNVTLIMSPYLCTLETCDLTLSSFEYRPTVAGNVIYAAIFVIAILAQTYLGVVHKTWGYMVAMLFGLFLELLGYIARILVHANPFDNDYFLMYLICLTIAPAFLTAAIYLCLSRIVIVYGPELSRFKPGTYTIVFCTCDIISLVLQAAGGAIASSANTRQSSDLGKNIMLAGLGFQVFSIILFFLACSEFAWRVRKAKGLWNPIYLSLVNSAFFKAFMAGLALATTTIFIRSTYRCIELSGGFHGTLFRSHEEEFMVLEGVMIVIATLALTVFHPGLAFKGAWNELNFKLRGSGRAGRERVKSDAESMLSRGDVEMGVVKGARR
ncbi:phospholipid-translocating ATPase rsb1 [Clarireedia jacksonii]